MKAKSLIGLDLGLTGTGLCVMWSDDRTHHLMQTLVSPKFPGCSDDSIRHAARLWSFRDQIHRYIKSENPVLAVLEDYAFNQWTSAYSIGELGGVVRVLLYEYNLPVLKVATTVLKKFVVGKGVAPKEVVMMHVLKKFQVTPADQHQADAYSLARIGYALLGWGGVSQRDLKYLCQKLTLPPGLKG